MKNENKKMETFLNPFEKLSKDWINTYEFCNKKKGKVVTFTNTSFLVETDILIDKTGDCVIQFWIPKKLADYSLSKGYIRSFRFNQNGNFKCYENILGKEHQFSLSAIDFIKGIYGIGY